VSRPSLACHIGIVILTDKFKKKKYEEVSHLENRYDEKTGKLKGSEKVVDSAEREAYLFNGEEYEEGEEVDLISDIAHMCGLKRFDCVCGSRELWMVSVDTSKGLKKRDFDAIADMELDLDMEFIRGDVAASALAELEQAAVRLKVLGVPFVGPLVVAALQE
jgi:hypothetical protein